MNYSISKIFQNQNSSCTARKKAEWKSLNLINRGWKKNKPCFWAIINENVEKEVRQFRIIGTGSYLYFEYKNFIGTCIDQKNQETWHIFEV